MKREKSSSSAGKSSTRKKQLKMTNQEKVEEKGGERTVRLSPRNCV